MSFNEAIWYSAVLSLLTITEGVIFRGASKSNYLHGDAPSFKLTLNNHKGVQYTAPISLDNQTLEAVYDTGSFEIMVISKSCDVCKISSNLNTYNNATSQSFVSGDSSTENHHFAGGSVEARQDFETIHVGTTDSIFKVDHMGFWQVLSTNMPVWMNKKAHFTGIVGLGHRSSVPDTPKGEKPMDSLIERTGTARFAICLLPGPANPGFLTFNPSYNLAANGMFRRTEVIGDHHWAVKLNSVSTQHGNAPKSVCGSGDPCVAIIDSGTSLLGIPPMAVDMVMELVNGIKYDCSNLDDLPDLVFELDGKKFAMPPMAYTVQFGEQGGKPSRCLPAFTDFAMTSGQGTVWILGMPFLRHFVTVFDRSEPAIYVADQGDNCEPSVPPSSSGNFFNATGLQSDMRRKYSKPTIADINEARLPSWAVGQKLVL